MRRVGDLAGHWTLDPAIDFLNHGSFGACPRPVLDAQQRLREEIERQPVEFFVRRLPRRIDEARARLADFLGARPEAIAPVKNATGGVNAVLRSLDLGPGDELLATSHAYPACRNTLDHASERTGARVVVADVPFPLAGPGDVVAPVLAALSPRTRLALIDHVTSPTGLVFPIETLVREVQERGVDALVDGAHAPGMRDLDLTALGAAYYVGNCHKWLCAPKGAGFLHVREDRRERIRPLAISHGATARRTGRSRFHDEFDHTGTDDPTAFLCVPVAIDVLGSFVPGGWPEIRRRNHDLAARAQRLLADALGIVPPCPESMLGSLAALPLPDGSADPPAAFDFSDPLQERLVRQHHIEVPIVPWPARPRRLVRISAQLYNRIDQYERLAAALVAEIAAEDS
jgi:isopenicillin-N epimerase